MRRLPAARAIPLLAIGAALAGAGQPPSPPATGPAPTPGDVVIDRLAVPPGVHITPEMRRRIEDAVRSGRLENAPHLAWGEARTIDVHGNEGGVRLAPGAVLASRTMALEPLQLLTDRNFEIGAMRARLPARTPFAVLVTAEGRVPCIDHGGQPFAVLHDERGRDYSNICLFDPDGDGRFEIVRFVPMQPGQGSLRDFAVDPPVALMPAPPTRQPRYGGIVQDRRLRVASIGPSGATILLETVPRGIPGNFPPSATAILPLAPGAEVSLAGVTLRAPGDGQDWRASTSGEIPAWSWDDEARAARTGSPRP
jgi:hypothetical protein